jgi:hypothetical protein
VLAWGIRSVVFPTEVKKQRVPVASRLLHANLKLRARTALQQTGSVLEVVRLSFFGDDVAAIFDERGL